MENCILKLIICCILVGVLYGTTSVAVGHPFDTIKTKMQAQRGFETEGMIKSFVKTVKTQGIRGLYRLVDIPFVCYLMAY